MPSLASWTPQWAKSRHPHPLVRAEYGFAGQAWTTLLHDTDHLVRSLRRIETLEEMAFAVGRLERWQHEARERLENLLAEAQSVVAESSYTAPLGAEYRPHQYTYKANDD